ncbi:DUF2142 domain-containing protein [Pantoea sp. CCBC3-3-1]|uniref:DUF2142 domain-containing protein n=1 Tax=Pantoea sp. CCBC3-3-1 TaxID=2490851 RepID=UPI0011BDCECD|nr:DUF2142 domain-containing protein [Pantoea sp. CCBC3-3-1]
MKGLFLGLFKEGGRGNYLLIFFLALSSFFYINTSNPPMSSPDEHYHIVRADTLSRGEILLENEHGKITGTTIDSSYVEFMGLFTMLGFDKSKISMADQINRSKKINWSDNREYLKAPNVSLYFPAIYLPQSLALFSGKLLGLSIYKTYMLARIFTFLTSILIILFAWRIHRIPAIALAVMALPMSVFQFSSASIDGTVIAITALIMSLYASLTKQNGTERSRKWQTALIYFLIFIVGTCKPNLAALILLPFSLAFITGNRKHILYSFATALPIVAWTIIAILNTNDGGVRHAGISNSGIFSHYIHHPIEMINIILGTMLDPFFINSFMHQLVGVLGWLDIYIPEWVFRLFVIISLSILVMSLKSFHPKNNKYFYIAITLGFLLSIVLIFFALLIQYSPLPTTRVIGIQGRYFIMPAIIIAYIFSENKMSHKDSVVIFIMFTTSVLMVKDLLLNHYF